MSRLLLLAALAKSMIAPDMGQEGKQPVSFKLAKAITESPLVLKDRHRDPQTQEVEHIKYTVEKGERLGVFSDYKPFHNFGKEDRIYIRLLDGEQPCVAGGDLNNTIDWRDYVQWFNKKGYPKAYSVDRHTGVNRYKALGNPTREESESKFKEIIQTAYEWVISLSKPAKSN